MLLAGCGGGGDRSAVFARAQDGLGRIRTGTIEVHATVHAMIPIERSVELAAGKLPLSRIHLTRWTRHPRRLACARGLECARADLDIGRMRRDLSPHLSSLPVDLDSIRSASIDVAVAKRSDIPRWLSLHGELDPGGLVPGSVPFDVELVLKHPRSG